MDTYRFKCYNIAMVEEWADIPRPHHTTAHQEAERVNEEERRVSAAQRKATDKYLEKFDEMKIRVPAGQKAAVKAHAESMGESLNGFLSRAITETMERDGSGEAAK